jgi:hypothetical protein
MNLTNEEILTAFDDAINYLQTEECSYDTDGNYRSARQWLAKQLLTMREKYVDDGLAKIVREGIKGAKD